MGFTKQLIAFRKKHPNLHRRKFFQDRAISPEPVEKQRVDGEDVRDIIWFRPDGQEMTVEEWNAGWVRCLGVYLSSRTIADVDRFGDPIGDKSFLICFNPHHENIRFYMPSCNSSCEWQLEIDTRNPSTTENTLVKTGEYYDMLDHSAIILCEVESEKLPPIDQHPEIEGPKAGQQLNLEHEVHPKPPRKPEKAEPAATKEELKEPEVKRKPRKKKS